MKAKRQLLSIIAAVAVGVTPVRADAASLTVKVTGLRNNNGNVGVGLFRSAKGFPDNVAHAYKRKIIHITETAITVIFENLDAGTYAVSVMHDENNNGKLDTNFLGIPVEGWGASNNPRPRWSAPTFDMSKFSLDESEKTVEISIKY